MSLDIEAIAPRPVVRRQDRLLDLTAALLLGSGVILFALGRRSLTAIADGKYIVQDGVSWIARADIHAAQTRWGLWLIAAGIAVALISALRLTLHRRRMRGDSTTRTTSPTA